MSTDFEKQLKTRINEAADPAWTQNEAYEFIKMMVGKGWTRKDDSIFKKFGGEFPCMITCWFSDIDNSKIILKTLLMTLGNNVSGSYTESNKTPCSLYSRNDMFNALQFDIAMLLREYEAKHVTPKLESIKKVQSAITTILKSV